jgi:hypothetical protein
LFDFAQDDRAALDGARARIEYRAGFRESSTNCAAAPCSVRGSIVNRRKPRRVKSGSGAKTSRVRKLQRGRALPGKRKKSDQPGGYLDRILALVRANPGIRPSEINRRLNLVQSDALRNALIKRGLVRKEKDGSAMRYYPV